MLRWLSDQNSTAVRYGITGALKMAHKDAGGSKRTTIDEKIQQRLRERTARRGGGKVWGALAQVSVA